MEKHLSESYKVVPNVNHRKGNSVVHSKSAAYPATIASDLTKDGSIHCVSSIHGMDVESSEVKYPFTYKIHNFDTDVINNENHTHSSNLPFIRLRDYSSLKLNEMEKDGYLSDRIIECCSCCVERSERPGKFILATCVLNRKNLRNIDIIQYHQFIKYLDLSRNSLTSLEPLGSLSFLQYLDVSHNHITTLFGFAAPINLSYANFSYNFIEDFEDLTSFWSLVYLDVSHNLIGSIHGIGALNYLNYLDVSYNRIAYLSNLNKIPLEILILDWNIIESFEENTQGLGSLLKLRILSISHNHLSSLSLVYNLKNLEVLDASHNKIVHILELINLKTLPHLYTLNLQGNKVCENTRYRKVCVFHGARLKELDGVQISCNEKVDALYTFTDNEEKIAAEKHAILEVVRHLQSPVLDSAIVPCHMKLVSIIIFCGPLASNKKPFVYRLCREYPKYTRRGISCTTRTPLPGEINGEDYNFLSQDEFNKLLTEGKFMSFTEKFGSRYGIEYSQLSKISENNSILVIHTDLVGALQIKAKFSNTKLVLTMPLNVKNHKMWLSQKYECSPLLPNFTMAYKLNEKVVEGELKISHSQHTSLPFKHVSNSIHTNSKTQGKAYGSEATTVSEESGSSTSTNEEFNQYQEEDNKTYPLNELFLNEATENTEEVSASISQAKSSSKSKVSSFLTYATDTTDTDFLKVFLYGEEASATSAASEYFDTREDNFLLAQTSSNLLNEQGYIPFLEIFIQKQIQRRDTYLELADSLPGLFAARIYSDDEKCSMDTVVSLLKQSVQMQAKYIDELEECRDMYIDKRMLDEKFKMLMSLSKKTC